MTKATITIKTTAPTTPPTMASVFTALLSLGTRKIKITIRYHILYNMTNYHFTINLLFCLQMYIDPKHLYSNNMSHRCEWVVSLPTMSSPVAMEYLMMFPFFVMGCRFLCCRANKSTVYVRSGVRAVLPPATPMGS